MRVRYSAEGNSDYSKIVGGKCAVDLRLASYSQRLVYTLMELALGFSSNIACYLFVAFLFGCSAVPKVESQEVSQREPNSLEVEQNSMSGLGSYAPSVAHCLTVCVPGHPVLDCSSH